MTVTPHDASDGVTTLREWVGAETKARRRDRYRAGPLAAAGGAALRRAPG